MSQVAEKTTPFMTALEGRPQGGPRWLEDLRSRGAARFSALGLPTVRDEDWRFTNVVAAGRDRLRAARSRFPAPPSACTASPTPTRRCRLVVVNGRFDTTLSRDQGLPAGVHVGSLAAALNDHADDGPALLRPARRLQRPKLYRAEHRLRAGRRVRPHPRRGRSSTRPIHIVFVSGAESVDGDGASADADRRRRRTARRGSSRATSASQGRTYFTNAVSEIFVGENAERGSLQGAAGDRSRRSTSPACTCTPRAARASRRTRSRSAARSCATTPRDARRRRRRLHAERAVPGRRRPARRQPHDDRSRQAALRQPRGLQGHPRRHGARACSTARSSSGRTRRRPTPSRPTARCC